MTTQKKVASTTTGSKRQGKEEEDTPQQGSSKKVKVGDSDEGSSESATGKKTNEKKEDEKKEMKQQKLVVEGEEDGEMLKKKEKNDDSEVEIVESKAQEEEEQDQLEDDPNEEKEGKGNAEAGEVPPGGDHLAKEESKRKHGILETGHVYFLYRPKVEVSEPHSLDEVSKFHLLLVPHGSKTHRLLSIGKKHLPDHDQSSRPMWGEVLNVGDDMKTLKKNLGSSTYETKTLGTRHQPGARVAASGSYVLHATENPPENSSNMSAVYHTHFAYEIALPHEMGEVQEALNIHSEGVFTLQVKNPEAPSTNPSVPNQDPSKHPQFPEQLQQLFKTKFIPADPPSLLDYPGAELLFIPSEHSVKEDIGSDGREKLVEEEKELEEDIAGEDGGKGDEVKRALKEGGLEGLIEGKALEGHWE